MSLRKLKVYAFQIVRFCTFDADVIVVFFHGKAKIELAQKLAEQEQKNRNFSHMKRAFLMVVVAAFVAVGCSNNKEQQARIDICQCMTGVLEKAGMSPEEMIPRFDQWYVDNGLTSGTAASDYVEVMKKLEEGSGPRPSYSEVYKAPAGELFFDELDGCLQAAEKLNAEVLETTSLKYTADFFKTLRNPSTTEQQLKERLVIMLGNAPNNDCISKTIFILLTTDQ